MNLRAACDHGRYERHETSTWTETNPPRGKKLKLEPCPGGREVTDAELAAKLVSHGWTITVTAPAKTAATGGNVDAPAI